MENVKVDVSRYDELIAKLKKKNIQTYTFTCQSGETCLLQEPTVIQTGKILPYLSAESGADVDYNKAGSFLVEECWLSGDDAIRKDESLKFEVGFAAIQTINLKVADIKKN